MDAFQDANPKITVEVTVSDWDAYWDKLQTGIAGGAAPDVFAMDGPLFPDYQSRDVLLDLKPFIDRDGLRPDPARRPGRRRLHDHRRRPVRPAARPQHDRPLLQQDDVRRGRPRLPGRHAGTGRSSSRSASSSPRTRTATAPSTSGASTPRRPTWRTTGARSSGRTAATSSTPDKTATRPRHARGGRRDPVPPGPDLEGEDHGRPGALRRDRRRLRAGQGRDGVQRLLARPDPYRGLGELGSPSGSRRCRRARPAGFTSVNPTGAVVYQGTKSPDAAWEFVKYLASPAAQEQLMELKASLPVEQGGPRRPVRDVVRGRRRPRRQPRLRQPQAVVRRLQRVHDDPPGRARRERLQRAEQDRRARRSPTSSPQLNAVLAGQ